MHISKISVIFIAFLFTFSSSKGQSNCSSSSFIQNNYKEDITTIAIEYMNNYGYEDSIEIPFWLEQDILIALSNVYYSSSKERDSVLSIFCIHNTYEYDVTTLEIGLDTSFTWVKNWINSQGSNSGNNTIDSLNALYPVTLDSVFAVGLHLNFFDTLNLAAMVKILKTIPGVDYCYLLTNPGDGHQIFYDSTFITFQLSWGDCLNQCLNERTYAFVNDTSTCIAHHVWTNGPTINEEPVDSPNVINCDTLHYVLTVCDSFSINLANDSLCAGTVDLGTGAIINGGTQPLSFEWTPVTPYLLNPNDLSAVVTGASSPIRYHVIATDSNGCKTGDYVDLFQAVSGYHSTNCDIPNNLTNLTAVVYSSSTYNVSWEPAYAFSNTSSLQTTVIDQNASNPILIIEDEFGCMWIDSLPGLNVICPNCDSLLQINLQDTSILCSTGAMQLGGNPSVTGSNPPFTYYWSSNDSIYLSSPSTPNPVAVLNSSTTVFLTATDYLGCSKTDSTFIHLKDNPQINLVSGCDSLTNLPFIEVNDSTNSAIYFNWYPSTEFSNPDSSWTLINVSSDSTSAFLHIADSLGCTNYQDSINIQNIINNCLLVNSDQFFSSDGINVFPNPANDIVNIKTHLIDPTFKIFTIHGEFIMESQKPEIHCSQLPQGIYIIRIYDNKELMHSKKVSVIR
ncbi:MAG: T9SS type A sorting domain-containing protein [Flavobacteriales bacterium]|nr:T9SS type A sorting domain-containing protein [Flavobacteriales bacterium]